MIRLFKAYTSVIDNFFWCLVAITIIIPFLNLSYGAIVSISILVFLIIDFAIKMFVEV